MNFPKLPQIDWPHEITIAIVAVGVAATALANSTSPYLLPEHGTFGAIAAVCTALAGLNLTTKTTAQKAKDSNAPPAA